MKTVVIGSNSFSGQDFAGHALACGDEVLGISRSPQKNQYELSYDKEDTGFRFLQLDLNKDNLKIAKVIRDFQPDHIINFAAQSVVEYSWKCPADWYNTNVTSLANLLPHLCQIGSIKKYLQISTPEVYGSCEQRIVESRDYNPSTPYASSKAAADGLLDVYRKQFGFPACMVRSANVYGARQQLFKIIPKTIISLLQGKKLPLHGGGLSTRSFIHISDVSRAERLVLEKGNAGDIFHISHDGEVSIRDLVGMICKEMGKDFEECVEISEDRKGKDGAYTLDSKKINDLGWFSQVKLEEGIRETISWVIKNNVHKQSGPLEYLHKR
jgi:dTDP-glucose 4,6-dehydratase|tara:strand:+ start:1819 stop:2796 length:978 start_codon:yes stop_codon:yes gene_type:complete